MFTSWLIGFRITILPLLLVIILPQVALSQQSSQTDIGRRFRQVSLIANYERCFQDTTMCSTHFVTKLDKCLAALDENVAPADSEAIKEWQSQQVEGVEGLEEQDGGVDRVAAFSWCICALYKSGSRRAWDTCSGCLIREYRDTTLSIWGEDCRFNTPGGANGGKTYKCTSTG